jgi:hypothetical protein
MQQTGPALRPKAVFGRWGKVCRFAVKHILPITVPFGDSAGAEVVDNLLECAEEGVKNEEQAAERAEARGTAAELEIVGDGPPSPSPQ